MRQVVKIVMIVMGIMTLSWAMWVWVMWVVQHAETREPTTAWRSCLTVEITLGDLSNDLIREDKAVQDALTVLRAAHPELPVKLESCDQLEKN